MAEFGWTVPCLVAEDGKLIAGHGRVLAATQLGLTEAPVIVLGHLTKSQRRAYRIADNKLTELGVTASRSWRASRACAPASRAAHAGAASREPPTGRDEWTLEYRISLRVPT